METPTLEGVLTSAESLPAAEQEMLENLLRQRRVEGWRRDTSLAAKRAIKAFRAGKLKMESAESAISRLRGAK